MSNAQVSDAELEGLSDEERAALAADDDAAALAAIAGTADEDDDAATVTTAATAAPAEEAPAETDTAAATADTTEEEDAPAPFVPVYDAQLPADFDAKVTELNTRHDALADKFNGGDLTFDEYRAQAKAISDELANLQALRTKAEISSEFNQQNAAQRWQWEVSRFMKDVLKSDGIDYAGNKLLNAALDVAVKDLANNREHVDKSGEWFLEEAHKQVKSQLGIGKTAPNTPAPTPKDPVKEAVNARKAQVPAAPTTLSAVPNAAEADVGQDEFAALDRLAETDVMAYERALAKLPADVQDRYLRAA